MSAWSKCVTSLSVKCSRNHGYNLLTLTILLLFCSFLMFILSVIVTNFGYNRIPYRDWALAGGVTSNSAQFRVRGPQQDELRQRLFVVSTNPNIAIEKDQILVTPVSYGDFIPEEYFIKRVSIYNLSPMATYYYGICYPQSIPNSATIAGDVGHFTTPAADGDRMNFTIATGSCALTGSKNQMFSSILDLNPLMFIHAGDFHYEDLQTLDIDKRLEAYDKVMGSPSQRILYMRTIFSYIWDDHDFLGNNEDSENTDATTVAKQSFSLAIPHYQLGAIQSNNAEEESKAAKYQAFTLGTVRFIISDLRSESVKSTESRRGTMYSTEQKNWLYNELSQAANYDFVIWVTSKPWTEPEEVGADSWGGFTLDRYELSSYIASTIGAGPKNLFVLSGDNHMVAFDDGSNTDYSSQSDYPGGFPLLHSGPLTNFGDVIGSETYYFTDGCMTVNSEVNHQFSTLEFIFPSLDMESAGSLPCIKITSYSENYSNVIFQKNLCGEIMRFGTQEQKSCTSPRFSLTTEVLFIGAAAIIGLNFLMSHCYLGLNKDSLFISYSYFGISIFFFVFTIGAAVIGSLCFQTLGVNVFMVSIYMLVQSVICSIFLGIFLMHYRTSKVLESKAELDDAEEVNHYAVGKEEDSVDKTVIDGSSKAKESKDHDPNGKEDIFEVSWNDVHWENENVSDVDDDYSNISKPLEKYDEIMRYK